MADDTVLSIDSAARVAYDLAVRIASDSGKSKEQRDEKYWLSLYIKCYKVTHNHSLASALKD